MKYLLGLVTAIVLVMGSLKACSEEDKVYVPVKSIAVFDNQLFFLNGVAVWIPITQLFSDDSGYYVQAASALCPKGHDGWRKVNGVWYCLNQDCPYFYGNNF